MGRFCIPCFSVHPLQAPEKDPFDDKHALRETPRPLDLFLKPHPQTSEAFLTHSVYLLFMMVN